MTQRSLGNELGSHLFSGFYYGAFKNIDHNVFNIVSNRIYDPVSWEIRDTREIISDFLLDLPDDWDDETGA